MQGKKKHKGTKAEIRAQKKRFRLIGTIITVAILVVLIALSSFLIYSYLKQSSPNPHPAFELKAAIVDHLSLTSPNQTFNQTATNILKQAGYTVDYYPGEEVNVEFYRNLPTHGYSLIVLRVHSVAGTSDGKNFILFFTSERFSSTKYFYEQWTDQVGWVGYYEGGPIYFGIREKFVRLSMNGRFNNAIIIMMGCEGLIYTNMAEAFIEKGAKVYISWNGSVSASHTDQATIQLLTYLTQNQTIREAVENTLNEVGPDPADNSTLDYYPKTLETQNYVILNTSSNLILKVDVATTISRRNLFWEKKNKVNF